MNSGSDTLEELRAVDCYSAGERQWMNDNRRLRERIFGPALRALERARVSANQLTLASLATGLAFTPLYLTGHTLWSLVALATHVLLDGLDGALARHRKTACHRGSFHDTMADLAVVASSTITLMAAHTVHAAAGASYLFAYTVLTFFAVARNALDIPYPWLVRPRFVVFAWIGVEAFVWPDTLSWVLTGLAVMLAALVGSGFLSLRNRLPER